MIALSALGDREVSTNDEASLVAACRQGDRDAFRVLVERHQDRAWTLAMHLAGNDAEASEIVQQAFVKAFDAIARFRGEARFGTWLHRIVVNAWRDEERRRRRLVPLDASAALPAPSLEEASEARQRRALVWKAVAALPVRLRLPVVLRYVDDLSYEDIGRALGCRPGTVASRLHRAQRRLAAALGALEENEVHR